MTKFNRIRAGGAYRFELVMIDQLHPPYNVFKGDVAPVVNFHGCPKAKTVGQTHVIHFNRTFGGLVSTNYSGAKGASDGIPDS